MKTMKTMAKEKKETKAKKTVKKEGQPKEVKKINVKKSKPKTAKAKDKKYFEAVGRRKTAVARVRLYQGEKDIVINDKKLESYFPQKELQEIVKSPFVSSECLDKFGATVILRGGGIHSQAEALRHGISRALVLFNAESRKKLKKAGYLTRDPRMRERKKFGLKRARRAPQWSKR